MHRTRYFLLVVVPATVTFILIARWSPDRFPCTASVEGSSKFDFYRTSIQGTWTTTNASTGLIHNVDPNGVTYVRHSTAKPTAPWRLLISGLLADGALVRDALPATTDEGSPTELRMESSHCTVQYLNDERGLRQNFIVTKAPKNARELRVRLEASDAEVVRLHEREVQLYRPAAPRPERLMSYHGLRAWDATGRELVARFETVARTIDLVVDAARAVYPVTIDPLSTGNNWEVTGNQAGAQFGHSARTAGDVNGDGYSDLLVGAPFRDGLFTDAGTLFLYMGGFAGPSVSHAWAVSGNAAGVGYGDTFSTAGDVNGDGFSDVIVGNPNFSLGTNTYEGRVEVYFGSATGLSTTIGFSLTGPAPNSKYGSRVTCMGDLNADGFSEIGFSTGDGFLNGATVGTFFSECFVHMGSASGPASTPAFTASLTNTLETLVPAGAGDVNGDGFGDALVGFPDTQVNKPGITNTVRLHLGSASGIVSAPQDVFQGASNSSFGLVLSTAGDVNGDGFADVLIGAPTEQVSGAFAAGRGYLYKGSANSPLVANSVIAEGNSTYDFAGLWMQPAGDVDADGLADVIIRNVDNTYQLLSGVAQGALPSVTVPDLGTAAGDVDGDGISDVIFGDQGFNNGGMNVGRAFVRPGFVRDPDLQPSGTKESDQFAAQLGFQACSAGDVNGDGFQDLLVTAPFFDNGQLEEGRAMVFHGSIFGYASAANWAAESNQSGAQFGKSAACAGDVNNDGFSDIIIGAPFYDNGQTNEGKAFVYLGSATGLSALAAWGMESNQAHANYGAAVSGCGDVNADGFPDIMIGAPFFDNGHTDEGRVFLYSGTSSGPSFALMSGRESNQTDAHFGQALAMAGDMNSDGYSDILIGAPDFDNGHIDEGRAFLYTGNPAGLTSTPLWTGEGNQTTAHFGSSVACAGDLNADRFHDIIIGAPEFDQGQTNEGAVFIFHGGGSGPQSGATTVLQINQANAAFGREVAAAGDVNGDGYSDLIVGAPLFDGTFTNEGAAMVFIGTQGGSMLSPQWTIPGGQQDANAGAAVASAGDLNGDGFTDLLIGLPLYDNGQINEGRLHMHLGAGGSPVQRKPRLYRTDLVGRLMDNTMGPANDHAYGTGHFARSPLGRQKARLVVERSGEGVAFSGTIPGRSTHFTDRQSNYTDFGVAGTELKMVVARSLDPQQRTRTRARLQYDPASALTGQAYGRWHMLGDYHTGGTGIIDLDPLKSLAPLQEVQHASAPVLRVFPVPSSGPVTVVLEGTTQFDWHVFSATGQLMLSGSAWSERTALDLGRFPRGTYTIATTDAQGRTSVARTVIN